MATQVFRLLTAVTGTGSGVALPMPGNKASIQIAGITAATVAIQASNDGGSNWSTLSSSTADQMLTLSEPYGLLRANVLSYTSGTITVSVCVTGV